MVKDTRLSGFDHYDSPNVHHIVMLSLILFQVLAGGFSHLNPQLVRDRRVFLRDSSLCHHLRLLLRHVLRHFAVVRQLPVTRRTLNALRQSKMVREMRMIVF